MALKDTAGSIIAGAGTIAGWLGIGEGRQDRRQIRQQGALNEVNAKTAKELADYEQGLRMKMWEDTNYKAQLAQADKAGVSKAAAIGGSGTGTQGASVSGISGGGAADAASTANARSAGINETMMLASQIALQKAQKENIEADTANKQAQAGNTTTITEGVKADNTVKKNTIDAQIQTIDQNAQKALHEADIARQQNNLNAETYQSRVTEIKANAIGQILQNEATKTGIKLDKARIGEIAENIAQRWKSLELEGKSQEISVENMERLTEAMLWGAGIQAGGKLVGDIIGIATKGGGTQTTEMINRGKDWSTRQTTTKPIK